MSLSNSAQSAVQFEAAQHHFRAGRLQEAAQLLNQVVEAIPNHGEALKGLAYIAASQRDVALAADYFERAVDHLPATAPLYHEAGTANQAAGRHVRAVECFERSLQLAPWHVVSLHAAAMSLSALGEHERALQMLTRAATASPGTWQIHYNMGRTLGLLGRYDAEMAEYRRAIELKPDCVAAYVNLGVALRDLHRFDEALRMFKKAVQLDPNDSGARTNRAQTNLLLGEFEHGWREYEWRWRDGGEQHGFGERPWLGDAPLAGKTLLVHSEQGLGDTLQFVRYVDVLTQSLANQSGVRLVLRVQDTLLPLLMGYPGVDAVIGQRDSVPPFDYHCPIMSLPHALKAHTIPAAPPYLRADPVRCAQWQTWLAGKGRTDGRRPRIGIAWSGNATQVNDRNRSMRLSDLASLFEFDAIFVSLQKEVREDDRETLRGLVPVSDISEKLDTFADTAALVAELDLVICVDTSVAHLAGALGRPVWVMLSFVADWRWHLKRSDSPWYPSARLFRQQTLGDWGAVVAEVKAALQAL